MIYTGKCLDIAVRGREKPHEIKIYIYRGTYTVELWYADGLLLFGIGDRVKANKICRA